MHGRRKDLSTLQQLDNEDVRTERVQYFEHATFPTLLGFHVSPDESFSTTPALQVTGQVVGENDSVGSPFHHRFAVFRDLLGDLLVEKQRTSLARGPVLLEDPSAKLDEVPVIPHLPRTEPLIIEEGNRWG